MEGIVFYYIPKGEAPPFLSSKYPVVRDVSDLGIENMNVVICDFFKGRYPGHTAAKVFRDSKDHNIIVVMRGKQLVGLVVFLIKDDCVEISIVCALEKGLGAVLLNIIKEFAVTLPNKCVKLTSLNKKLDNYYIEQGFKKLRGAPLGELEWRPTTAGKRIFRTRKAIRKYRKTRRRSTALSVIIGRE